MVHDHVCYINVCKYFQRERVGILRHHMRCDVCEAMYGDLDIDIDVVLSRQVELA